MPANRTVYTITLSSKGGADVVAAAASALAATYEVYKNSDSTYASSALNHAQQLYALATNLPSNATYCAEVACFEGLKSGGYRWKAYLSESVYDDLALAAAWLYKATGEGHAENPALSQHAAIAAIADLAACRECHGWYVRLLLNIRCRYVSTCVRSCCLPASAVHSWGIGVKCVQFQRDSLNVQRHYSSSVS